MPQGETYRQQVLQDGQGVTILFVMPDVMPLVGAGEWPPPEFFEMQLAEASTSRLLDPATGRPVPGKSQQVRLELVAVDPGLRTAIYAAPDVIDVAKIRRVLAQRDAEAAVAREVANEADARATAVGATSALRVVKDSAE